MNTDNIVVNTQSSIKIILDKIIYFDPFKIEEETHDADVIFVTHAHHDHFDPDSINKISNDNTIIVAPKTMEQDLKNNGITISSIFFQTLCWNGIIGVSLLYAFFIRYACSVFDIIIYSYSTLYRNTNEWIVYT